ncbi:hypothetical protein V2J09_015855 [Rumex salicifolius]
MALRPIDNAPTPNLEIDRPKKQPKLSIPLTSIQKNKRSCLPAATMKNDENQAPPPNPNPETTIEFEYFASKDLKPLSDPQAKIQMLVEGLESKDWTVICDSVNDVRRFAIFHSDLLLPVLEKVIAVLVKAMKNPRSTLCKTSIMASSDVFCHYGNKFLELNDSGAFDQLLPQLLLKASQDKRFVCEEADKTLTAMVESVPPLPLLHKLKAYVSHNNLRIRAKAAISISNCVSKMNTEELKEFGMVSLLKMAADMLKDRLPEAREAARSTVMFLYKSFPGSEEGEEEEEQKVEAWQLLCQDNLPALHAQSIIKITLPQ